MTNRSTGITCKKEQGWSEETLIKLSKPKSNQKQFPYWTSEVYGFGKYIRNYGFYPQRLPLCISTDHGPSQQDKPIRMDLECDSPYHFYHSPRLVNEWKKFSRKPCYNLYSPVVFYRRSRQIQQSDWAKGTLAFPSHSTTAVKEESDWKGYIEQLLTLPAKFQPISACVYYQDILEGKHKVFQDYGIPIFTAGHSFDVHFIERFYEILRHFQFTTSNYPGSYLFYSVEMGIPFFLHGMPPSFFNSGKNKDFDIGYLKWREQRQFQKLYDLFGFIHTQITDEQKEFVYDELGLKDGVGRVRMATLLYLALMKYYFRRRKRVLKLSTRKVVKVIKHFD